MGKKSRRMIRIRKMKPEPVTVTSRRAWLWGEKEEKTVMGTLLLSCLCFQWFCCIDPNRPVDEEVSDPEQIQVRPSILLTKQLKLQCI